jgi:hypothetical protein
MRIAAALALAVLLAGCASSGDTPDPRPGPTVDITQTTSVRLIHSNPSNTVPVDYSIKVTNPLDEPVKLISLELETVGYSGSYTMKRVKHAFSQIIAPKETQTIAIRAWVQPLQENTRGEVVAPVNIRGSARFDSNGTVLRTLFTEHVEQ